MTLANNSFATVACSSCGNRLSGLQITSSKEFTCVSCGAKLLVEVFPALYRTTSAVICGEALTTEGEASCFYHPHKKAVDLCTACGRFICSLCETELGGKCLCPPCIDAGRKNEALATLVNHRVLYDSMALSMSLLPLLFFPATIITAPITIYIAIRYWKQPGSILPRTRLRFVLAIIFAMAQIVGWLTLLVTMVYE